MVTYVNLHLYNTAEVHEMHMKVQLVAQQQLLAAIEHNNYLVEQRIKMGKIIVQAMLCDDNKTDIMKDMEDLEASVESRVEEHRTNITNLANNNAPTFNTPAPAKPPTPAIQQITPLQPVQLMTMYGVMDRLERSTENHELCVTQNESVDIIYKVTHDPAENEEEDHNDAMQAW